MVCKINVAGGGCWEKETPEGKPQLGCSEGEDRKGSMRSFCSFHGFFFFFLVQRSDAHSINADHAVCEFSAFLRPLFPTHAQDIIFSD